MLTLGGIPLTYETRELAQWLDQTIPPELADVFAPPQARENNRWNRRREATQSCGLPRVNLPEVKSVLRLGSLWWPTGACRWACGAFPATGETVAALQALGTAQVMLRMDDEQGRALAATMWLLPPRPLSAVPDQRTVWMVPVVDDRYFWQQANVGNLEIDAGTTTWADLYTAIGTELGVTIAADAVPAAYVLPDPVELTRRYENAAVVLDAVAECCGQRIVRQLDGTIQAQNAATATGLRSAALLAPQSILAGGPIGQRRAITPAQISVVFPRYCGGAPDCEGKVYKVDKPAGDFGATAGHAIVRTIFDTAAATFDAPEDTTPTNDADLDDLATQIASDQYAWLAHAHDLVRAGTQSHTFNGFDDYALWSYGRFNRTTEKQELYCRITSRPDNSFAGELCHQFDGAPDAPAWIRVRLTSNLSPSGSATGYRQVWDSGSSDYVDTGSQLTVYEYTGKQAAASGSKIYARHWCDRCEYEAIVTGVHGAHLGVTTTSDVTGNATFTADIEELLEGNFPPGAAIGVGITVINQVRYALGGFVFRGGIGLTAQVRWDPVRRVYYVIWVECPPS